MIVTETDARGKICPQSIARGPEPHSANHELVTCCGSTCMAWRWLGWIADGSEVSARMASSTDPTAPNSTVKWTRYGYCGLAGSR